MQSAVFERDLATAASVLAGTDTAGTKTASYYNVAAELALAMRKPADAEADFAEAARLDPANPAPMFSAAILQLHHTNALDMAEARIKLKRISMNTTNSAIRCQAQRELIIDALRNRDYATAQSVSADLLQSTNVLFTDKLMRLEALKSGASAEYNSALAAAEREAATDPNETHN